MIAAARQNNWGMVGAAPVRIVSVRAQRPGESTIFFDDWRAGVELCRRKADIYNIKAISLSLGSQGRLDDVSQSRMQSTVDFAITAGMDVVAAAGNQPGPPDTPASYGAVFAVGAANNAGARCSFAASGSEVDLYAPGCPQDVAMPDSGAEAWVSGSSGATAFTAAILAQLRALRPDLTAAQAEALVTEHAQSTAAGRYLDVRAAFAGAGLVPALAQGDAATPKPPPVELAVPPPAPVAPGLTAAEAPVAKDAAALTALAHPRVRTWSLTHGMLRLTLANRPPGAEVQIALYRRKNGRSVLTARRSANTARVKLKVRGAVAEIRISYAIGTRRSRPLILHRRP
jgi:hypothetical protein